MQDRVDAFVNNVPEYMDQHIAKTGHLLETPGKLSRDDARIPQNGEALRIGLRCTVNGMTLT